jgi:multicomponent Na+:H+ antiporter subunit C
VSLALALGVGVLFAVGTYLLLQRTLTRIVLGIGLLGHATVLLLVATGPRGEPPVGVDAAEGVADPLPQALALTAIVITMAITVFVLTLANRSWEATHDDEVQDDLEDRRVSAEAETTIEAVEESDRPSERAPRAEREPAADGEGQR